MRRRLFTQAIKGEWPEGTPQAIRDSAVLWYDVDRQGCTNSSMQANPILKDLTGNGHDAECLNFSWSETSSGIMELATCSISNWSISSSNGIASTVETEDGRKGIVAKSFTTAGAAPIYATLAYGESVYMEMEVSGIDESIEGKIYFGMYQSNEKFYIQNGKQHIYFRVTEPGNFGLRADTAIQSCLISMLFTTSRVLNLEDPDAWISSAYPYINASGVSNTPNFTVIACRQWISIYSQTNAAFVSRCPSNSYTNGDFCIEHNTDDANMIVAVRGAANSISKGYILSPFMWCTNTYYNGFPIDQGTNSSYDQFIIGKKYKNASTTATLVFHSILLFNRELTEEEVMWVKTNICPLYFTIDE